MKLAVISILLILATQLFSKWLIVIDFSINQDYIATVLCENRNKPSLKCNGKCQLTKKLTQDTNNENNSTNSKWNAEDSLFFHVPGFSISHWKLNTEKAYTSYHLIYPFPTPASIFHPPCS